MGYLSTKVSDYRYCANLTHYTGWEPYPRGGKNLKRVRKRQMRKARRKMDKMFSSSAEI